jgi:acyl-coenzyme A thioesterase PaaI-like protein
MTSSSRSGAAVLRLLCAVAVSSNTATTMGFYQPQPPTGGHHHHHHHPSASSSTSSDFSPASSLVINGRSTTMITVCHQRDVHKKEQMKQSYRERSMLYQTSRPVNGDDDQMEDTTNGHIATLPSVLVDTEHHTRMKIPDRATDSGHAIFGVLRDDGLIERYEIWKQNKKSRRKNNNKNDQLQPSSSSAAVPSSASRLEAVAVADDEDDMKSADDNNVVVAFVTFGDRLNGHKGIVHGGILSLVVDDLCGFAFEAIDVPHAVTANLNLDYRAPVPANTTMKIAIQLDKREGRKLYWTVQMTSLDGAVLYVEATSLYIIPRSNA